MIECTTEYGRNVMNLQGAHSSEFDKDTQHPVICLLDEQQNVTQMGGTMRLGIYPCQLVPETNAALAYKSDIVNERHRHRWEFNNAYREQLHEAGMIYSGLSPDGHLVEIAELAGHPFMLGSQFHPEFKSRPDRPHPLFSAFLEAVITHKVPVDIEAIGV